jgi:AcrR family transcriptional regulator
MMWSGSIASLANQGASGINFEPAIVCCSKLAKLRLSLEDRDPMDGGPPFPGMRRGYHHGRLKEALIEAARSLVAERGATGFTLAEAAKLAGVTAAAPYRHFSDRNALLSELARQGFELFGQRLKGAWNDGRPDPSAAMVRMGTAYLAFAREEPGLYSAMFANAQAPVPPATGLPAQTSFLVLETAAAAVLQQHGANPAGSLRLAQQIWALSHGVAMLMLAGYLVNGRSDCAPEAVLDGGCTSLVEMAVERGRV